MTAPETAVLLMTDLHNGKKTRSYNPKILKKRLDLIAGNVSDLIALHPQVQAIRPMLLGDVTDGTDVYRTQPHHQAVTDVEEQAWSMAADLTKFFQRLHRDVIPVEEIDCTPGNHGHAGRMAHEAANWDMTTYRYMSQNLGDEIPVKTGKNTYNPFLIKTKVRGHGYLLHHGHTIKSWSGIPFYGIRRRAQNWLVTERYKDTKVICLGHFHSCERFRVGRVRIFMSGSSVTDDAWAEELGFGETNNQWWLIGVSDKRPVTWTYEVDLN